MKLLPPRTGCYNPHHEAPVFVKTKHLLLAVGLVAYVASFFLPAVYADGRIYGYSCAWIALLVPWIGWKVFHEQRFQYFSILFSGLINPVFLIIAVLQVWNKMRRLRFVLSAALVLMLPFCWSVFRHGHNTPLVGYYLWTISMLLVVLAPRLAKSDAKS